MRHVVRLSIKSGKDDFTGLLARTSGWVLMGIIMFVFAAACSSGSNQRAFRPLNEAVADIKPSLIGKVVYDKTSGSAKPLSQGPARYLLIFATGDHASTMRAVNNRMTAAGFSELGANAWRRVKDNSTVLVYINLIDAGQKTPSGPIVPSGHTGVWLNVNAGT